MKKRDIRAAVERALDQCPEAPEQFYAALFNELTLALILYGVSGEALANLVMRIWLGPMRQQVRPKARAVANRLAKNNQCATVGRSTNGS